MFGGKVLLVTNDQGIVTWVQRALSGFRSVVEVSPDPLHALMRICQAKPDFVLVDAMVDDGPGPCLCERLNTNERFASIPVIELVPDRVEPANGRYRALLGADSVVRHPSVSETAVRAFRGPRGPPVRHAQGTEPLVRSTVRPPD